VTLAERAGNVILPFFALDKTWDDIIEKPVCINSEMISKKSKKIKGKQDRREKASAGINIGRFVVSYLLLMGIFYFLTVFTPLTKRIDIQNVYTKSVVLLSSKVLGLVGIPCTYKESIINLPGITLDVKFGCNGLEVVMIYSVAVVAFPATWKRKTLGILAGFLVLQVINILRIVALAYSGVHFKNLFEYIHVYVAQGIMIAVSLVIFFVYIDYAQRHKTAST